MDEAKRIYESLTVPRIRRYIQNHEDERLHLEFKAITDPELSKDDKKNLAVALSGFANADGGVILWGVDARSRAGKDIRNAQMISPTSRFLNRLNELTGSAISPPADGILHRRIPANREKGFVATLVPASNGGPHMAKLGENRYFQRIGDSFVPMEHFQIADMFGRRSRPALSLKCEMTRGGSGSSGRGYYHEARVLISLENSGRGSARAVFVKITSTHDVHPVGNGILKCIERSGRELWFVGDSTYFHHPGVSLDVARIGIQVLHEGDQPPDLIITWDVRADGTQPTSGQFQRSRQEIRSIAFPESRF